MPVVETFDVPARGIGKPDYTREVSAAISRAGVYTGYRQTLKMFAVICHAIASPLAWCEGQLAIGATTHLIDTDTGLVMPYTLPLGYTMDLLDRYISPAGDIEVRIHFDTFLAIYPGNIAGGQSVYINQINPYSTRTLDPAALAAHLIDIVVTNTSGAAVNCGVTAITIQEELGTEPLSPIKPIRCKHCGNIDEVPYQTTNHICSKCGKLTIVYNMRDFRGR